MTLDIQTVLVVGHGRDSLSSVLPQHTRVTCVDLVPGPGIDIVAEEDRLPLDLGSFDLVFACGTLDSIDDLPGALILMRRALRPGGLFLGAMLGAGSLSAFRRLVQTAESETTGQAAMRFHPQIEVRAAGDLLFRAGFSMPVADQQDIEVLYTAFHRLRDDLKGAGARSALQEFRPLARAPYLQIKDAFSAAGFAERFAPIYLTGWRPEEGEKRPSGPVKGAR